MTEALLAGIGPRARATDIAPLRISVLRKEKLPVAWRSFPITVRLENISKKSIKIRIPRIVIGPGDHWTTIQFLAEHAGAQIQTSHYCAYEASYDFPTIILEPGEKSPPFEFDVQMRERCIGWDPVDQNEKRAAGAAQLSWGHYKVRVRYFNGVAPMAHLEQSDDAWVGEVVSEPIELIVL